MKQGFEDMERRVPDIRKMHRITGFATRVGLDDALLHTRDWFRSASAAAADRVAMQAPLSEITMNANERLVRHARITYENYQDLPSPPFLILFINSICNQKCEHCFYWRNLNRRDDLTKEELFALSRSLGRIENLNLSGGEPFLRPEFGEICRQFIRQNKVRQIYVPTNGYFTDRTVKQITETLKEKDLDLFVAEISLDGLGEFHDKFRGSPGAFDKAMETYEALAKLQESDPRLRIHSISTATDVNMDEIRRLTTYLFDRCPKMDHHNLAMIRGDRKNPSLQGPSLDRIPAALRVRSPLVGAREEGRYGSDCRADAAVGQIADGSRRRSR